MFKTIVKVLRKECLGDEDLLRIKILEFLLREGEKKPVQVLTFMCIKFFNKTSPETSEILKRDQVAIRGYVFRVRELIVEKFENEPVLACLPETKRKPRR